MNVLTTTQLPDTSRNVTIDHESLANLRALKRFLVYYASVTPPTITGIPTAICVFGAMTNFILFSSLLKYRRYTTLVHIIIISLGITDLGGCLNVIVGFNTIISFIKTQALGFLCHVCWFSGNVFGFATVYHLCLFAILRFLQLSRPLWSRAMLTPSLVTKVCCTIWFIRALLSIPIGILYHPITTTVNGKLTWFGAYPPGVTTNRNITLAFFLNILPICIVISVHVAKHIVVSTPNVAGFQENPIANADSARKQTGTRTMVIVLAVCFCTFTWTAIHMFADDVLSISLQSYHYIRYLYEIYIRYVGSVINPWIYAIAAAPIRHDMINFALCKPASISR